jgi:hypothetical protein
LADPSVGPSTQGPAPGSRLPCADPKACALCHYQSPVACSVEASSASTGFHRYESLVSMVGQSRQLIIHRGSLHEWLPVGMNMEDYDHERGRKKLGLGVKRIVEMRGKLRAMSSPFTKAPPELANPLHNNQYNSGCCRAEGKHEVHATGHPKPFPSSIEMHDTTLFRHCFSLLLPSCRASRGTLAKEVYKPDDIRQDVDRARMFDRLQLRQRMETAPPISTLRTCFLHTYSARKRSNGERACLLWAHPFGGCMRVARQQVIKVQFPALCVWHISGPATDLVILSPHPLPF